MAETENEQTGKEPEAYRIPKYKFMTNLLVAPKNRTTYIKALEKVSPDASVSFLHVMLGLGVGAFIIIFYSILLMNSVGPKAKYVLFPVIIALIASLILNVIFLIPSRGKSMLSTTLELLIFKISENTRLKLGRARLSTMGVKKIHNDGVLEFESGFYGAIYKITGQIGLATLPAVAELITGTRHQHLIARTDFSQEILITEITKFRADNQMNVMLNKLKQLKQEPNSLENQWKKYMLEKDYEYVKQMIHEKDSIINQYLILCDVDSTSLYRTVTSFEGTASDGYVADYQRLTNRREIKKFLMSVF